MGSLGEEVLGSARTRIGAPFLHHFKPENLCEGGTVTVDGCMQKGLDRRGYDCSGLVVASLCDVLGIRTDGWPRHYRHLNQIKNLASSLRPETGDIMVFDPDRSNRRYHGGHIGVFVTRNCVIHASGISGFVEEGEVEGAFQRISVIPAGTLTGLATC